MNRTRAFIVATTVFAGAVTGGIAFAQSPNYGHPLTELKTPDCVIASIAIEADPSAPAV